ncbi:MAG: hypothetical protein PHQ12_12875 [Chthoniobacteraceae bacterium]|nr:hypothetical protein [Chthoniobacteraceae bacterium]
MTSSFQITITIQVDDSKFNEETLEWQQSVFDSIDEFRDGLDEYLQKQPLVQSVQVESGQVESGF